MKISSILRGGKSSPSKSGFTLVELLVVVAAIALLTALLLPVMGRVRESGRRNTCLSNMKQLGLAFQQYAQDNSNRLPDSGSYQYWNLGGHWIKGNAKIDADGPPYATTGAAADVEGGAIYPYAKDARIFACPSNRDKDIKKATYSMNCAIGSMSIVRMRTPTDIVLLVDEAHNNDGFFYATDNVASGAVGTSTDALTDLHNGGGNLLFCDGHVKFYPLAAFPLTSNDDNPEAKTVKFRTTGSPRFHDSAFGPKGSYYRGPVRSFAGFYLDQCYAPIDAVPPTP